MRRLSARRNPGWIMRNRMIHLIDQIEQNAGAIVVRELIDGQSVNVPLIEMPTHLAIQQVCKILREGLINGASRPS